MWLNSLLSLIAILGLAGLNRWLGQRATLTRSRGHAPNRIGLDLIDFVEQEGAEANAGDAYLARGQGVHEMALAIAVGDSWAVRRIGPGLLRDLRLSGGRLELAIADFSLPRVTLDFANPGEAARWYRRLAAMSGTGGIAKMGASDALVAVDETTGLDAGDRA